MPSTQTLIVKDVDSDLSPTWNSTTIDDLDLDFSPGGTATTRLWSIPLSSTRSLGLIWLNGKPNSDVYPSIGFTQYLNLKIATGNMDLRGRIRIHRLNSTGTIQDSGSFGSWVTLSTDIQASCNAPTWGTELCSDRFAIELEVENLSTMKDLNFELDIEGTPTNETEVYFSVAFEYDTATCTGGVTFTPKCIMF
jgi:hypothetical protein